MTAAADRAALHATDSWFIRRGLPMFVEDYRSDTDVWTRALPVLAAAVAVLLLGIAWSVSSVADVIRLALAFLAVLVGYALLNRRRGRPAWALPERVGPATLVTLIVLPGLLQFAATRSAAAGLIVSGIAVVIEALAYVVTRYALVAVLVWAVRWTFRQLGDVLRLATRALPLLLLVQTFLFINTEVWQVAGSMPAGVLWLSLAVFALLGIAFLVGRVPEETRRIEESTDRSAVIAACAATPLHGRIDDLPDLDAEVPLAQRQRANLGLMLTVAQAVQVVTLALVVWAFFVGFGALAISIPVQEAWLGGLAAPDVLVSLNADHGITRPLLRVATFLGGFAGFYVTIYAATDQVYREQFFGRVADVLSRALAVRRAYLALRRHCGLAAPGPIGR